MTKTSHLTHGAGVAIAAALAFGPTPVLAQVATDVPAAPVVVPEAAPPPAIVVPDLPPVSTESTPVVQPVPEPTAEAVPAPAAAPAATPVRRTVATQPAAPASPAPAASPAVPPVEAAPEAVIAPAPAAPVAAAQPQPGPTPEQDDSTAFIAALLGALAVIALAIWGFIAIGRHRRPNAVPVVERPVVTEPVPPAAAVPAQPITVARPAAPIPAASLAHSGAAVALPRQRPQSFEERDALLKRMVDARPDRANPFTNRKSRLRRARLILQSLDRDFGDTRPWIDLSQYPGNWPELARNQHVAA